MKHIPPTPLTLISAPVTTELTAYRRLFESVLHHDERILGEVLAHIRQRQGKMMRPILVLLMAREAGSVTDKALTAAVALELLHTASLVHDDVVDESALRRGLPSVNQKYGNKVAVLLGDYLLSLLLGMAAETQDSRIVERIAKLGGTLSEGEIIQLGSSRKDVPDEAAYLRIISHKTAALFATCAELGALAAGADDQFTTQARQYGELIGMCFQIRDDIFDFYDDKAIGKPTGNDLREGKFTLPVIHALRIAPSPTLQPAIARVQTGSATAEDIDSLVCHTKEHGGIDYARCQMEKYRDEAISIARSFHNDEVRQALIAYAEYVVAREV